MQQKPKKRKVIENESKQSQKFDFKKHCLISIRDLLEVRNDVLEVENVKNENHLVFSTPEDLIKDDYNNRDKNQKPEVISQPK